MCVSGSKKWYFFGKLCVLDASMVHLIAIILRIFRKKRWFGLAMNYKRKCVRKPILVDLGTRIFKRFSLVETVVVPPRGSNISKLLTALFIFIRPPSLKVALISLYKIKIWSNISVTCDKLETSSRHGYNFFDCLNVHLQMRRKWQSHINWFLIICSLLVNWKEPRFRRGGVPSPPHHLTM